MATGGLVLRKLDEIVKAIRANATGVDIAFGGGSQEQRLENYPVAGRTRVVTKGHGRGQRQLAIAAAAWTDLVPKNAGRGGLSLINIGANPCWVFLATAGAAQNDGVFSGYLFADGGEFDGKITHELWCGPISLYSPLGTTIVWGEL